VTSGWLALAVLLLPLAAALVAAAARRPGSAHGIAALAMAADTVLAGVLAVRVVGAGAVEHGPHATWIDLGAFTLGAGVLVDPMGAILALIVCLLATLVLVFNAWYMHGDALAARFPWQLCFFAAAMLGVVFSDNLLLSFACWELVGLGSYLLIGFWFDRPPASEDADYQRRKGRAARGVLEHQLSPAHAQLKAFMMNRVGDAGFLLGIGALLAASLAAGRSGSVLDFAQLHTLANEPFAVDGAFLGLSREALLFVGALGILCGAIGKSAQFPLHPWLPDAMQGPTTASSIIHAATMVAAGVFLVARCYPMFPPDALAVTGWIGGVTCFVAATIACVQWDLKAVLAYSTVSQLGLMFVGLGAGEDAGGRAAGIAHLFTHAFFKCLLFLCAGAVIHACAGAQDLHRMGGLRRRMPWTAAAAGAGVLAIAGVPLFSAFFSKDAVLAAALLHARSAGGAAWGPFALACGGSLLTSAYMLRWWLRIFAGGERDHDVVHHAHDPAGTARAVLVALVPFALALPWTAGGWLDHALGAPHGDAQHAAHGTATAVAFALLAVGAGFAAGVFWWLPRRGVDAAAALAVALRPLHAFCADLWRIDALWDRVVARGLGRGLAAIAARFDLGSPRRLAALENAEPAPARDAASLDGALDGLGRLCWRIGRGGSVLHAGRLGAYLAVAAIVGCGGLLLVLLR
jgi:NADH:ubiquinone oxidoreductase subunit 5 (subunit L)/multisubunit Na+/H+ antiporter MnhA subunit